MRRVCCVGLGSRLAHKRLRRAVVEGETGRGRDIELS